MRCPRTCPLLIGEINADLQRFKTFAELARQNGTASAVGQGFGDDEGDRGRALGFGEAA